MELFLKNDFAEIPPAADAVDGFLRDQGAGPEILYLSRLVIEELVSNTIKYGYDDQAVHEIRIDARVEEGTMIIEISDDGHPFNPLEAPEPAVHLPVNERPVGGLGLHLVRSMGDSVEYRRSGANNIVTVRKSYPV